MGRDRCPCQATVHSPAPDTSAPACGRGCGGRLPRLHTWPDGPLHATPDRNIDSVLTSGPARQVARIAPTLARPSHTIVVTKAHIDSLQSLPSSFLRENVQRGHVALGRLPALIRLCL